MADEVLGLLSGALPAECGAELPALMAATDRSGDLLDALARMTPVTSWVEAARAYSSGAFVRAADLYADIGTRPDEARARLAAASALVAGQQRAEVDEQLRRALRFYRSVDATTRLRESEALLAETG